MHPTLLSLLQNAVRPMGHTLYIYGGGWNTEDTGAAEETRTLGVSPVWQTFFESRDALYTYKSDDDPQSSYYPHDGVNTYHALGLDCSGYVGWVVYNTLCTENGKEGFVTSSTRLAHSLASMGLGDYTRSHTLSPGDIVSMKGHVWLCIGVCADESVVIAHSSPTLSRRGQPGGGVQLTALCKPQNKICEAYRLADRYMKLRFPSWYARYPVTVRDLDAYMRFEEPLTGKFSWRVLCDPDGIHSMGAEEILSRILPG